MKIDDRVLRKPSPSRNSHRWDEIGGYVVSTVRLPKVTAEFTGLYYETLVYSLVEGRWDADNQGVQSANEAEANEEHLAACARVRGRIQ